MEVYIYTYTCLTLGHELTGLLHTAIFFRKEKQRRQMLREKREHSLKKQSRSGSIFV